MTSKSLIIVLTILLLPLTGFCASRAGQRMKLYFKDAFIPHLWDGTKNTFGKPENLAYLAAGGALAATAHQYDWEVDEYWEEHEMDYGLADVGNGWGDAYLPIGLSVSMMLGGWHYENEKIANAGEALAEAMIIQGAVINIIKPIANKERPDQSDNLAFPSGHTGVAFVTAAVLHDRFGWKAGVPAYSLAVITGLARMDVEKHWVADVVMGATIGMVTGYSVSRHHDDYPYEVKRGGPALGLAPMVSPDRYGVLLVAAW